MSESLTIAIQAAKNEWAKADSNLSSATRAAIHALLPAEPPSSLMSAIHMAIERETGIQINTPISHIIWRMIRSYILGT